MADAYLLKAKCLEALAEYKEAAALYLFLVDTYPGTPHAYQATGRLSVLSELYPAGIDL